MLINFIILSWFFYTSLFYLQSWLFTIRLILTWWILRIIWHFVKIIIIQHKLEFYKIKIKLYWAIKNDKKTNKILNINYISIKCNIRCCSEYHIQTYYINWRDQSANSMLKNIKFNNAKIRNQFFDKYFHFKIRS